MEITELSNDKKTYQAQVSIPSNVIEQEIAKKLTEISKTAKVDGFREGKVPVQIIRKKFEDSARREVIGDQFDAAIRKILQDGKLNILTDPMIEDVENSEGSDLKFKVKFDLAPEITIPDLSKISIEKSVIKITDKDIEDRMSKIAEISKAYDTPREGGAKEGDQVTMNAVGYVDGKAFEGGKLEGFPLVLGSKMFIDNFEDQLIGAKKGDKVTVKVNFPDNYHEKSLAGKPAEFKVEVLDIHVPNEAKIDEEFAKKFNCKDVDELKGKIKLDLENAYAEPVHILMKKRLFDALEPMIQIDAPDSLVNHEIKALEEKKDQLMAEDAKIADMSEEERKEYFKKIANRRISIGLLLAEYVKVNKLTITEQDVQEVIMNQVRQNPGYEQQIFDYYQNNKKAVESLKGPVLEEKAVKTIFEKEIKIKEKAYEREEFDKLLQDI